MQSEEMSDEDPGALGIGVCCVCGETGSLCAIGLLPLKGPAPGKGWGCFQCGLPSDGAVVVACDRCENSDRDPIFACAGLAREPGRVPISELTQKFEHDLSKHSEMQVYGKKT